jgi:hypothetical protein
MGEYVYVQFGKVAGLPTLTGVGRIIKERERAGMLWVLVEPVFLENSIPLEKWVLHQETQYIWENEVLAA